MNAVDLQDPGGPVFDEDIVDHESGEVIACAGEPLDPARLEWALDTFLCAHRAGCYAAAHDYADVVRGFHAWQDRQRLIATGA